MASKIDAINELRNARKKQEEEKNKTARQTTQSAAASRVSAIEELREKRSQQSKAVSERMNNASKSRVPQATQQKTTPTSANKTQSAWANARGDILKSVANKVGSTSVGKSVAKGTTTQGNVGTNAPRNSVEEYISNANKNIDAKIAERKAELESMGSRSVSLGGNTDMYIKKEMRDGKIIGTPVFAASDPEFDKRYKELEKEIALLEREKNRNAKTLRWNAYKNDMQSEDFEEYAKMGAYIANPAAEDVSKTTEFLGGLFKWRGYDDDAYDAAQNKVAFVRNNWDKLNSTTQSVLTSEGQDLYRYLEEDEANLYYSYLAKEQEGIIPAGSADAFLEFMKDDLNYRKGTKKGVSDFEDIYDDPGIIRGLRTAKYAYDTAVDRFVSDKIDYYGKLTGLKDDVSPTSVQQYAGQYVRNNSGSISKVAYDVGDTAGYMAIPMLETVGVGGLAKTAGATPKLAGTLSSATMGTSIGTSAAGGAYKQALAEGYSEDEAWAYGNAVGASEAVLQSILGAVGGKLPNKLMAKAASIKNPVGRFGAMLAINNLGELAEEELQLIIEPAIRSALFDVDYEGPELEEYLYTALITSLSTGMYSAPYAAANAFGVELPQNYLEDPDVKTAVDEVKNDRTKLDSLIESAKGFGTDTKAVQAATRIEQAVQEENEISDDDVAELLVENSRERSNELRKQRDAEVESVLGDETRVEELLQKSYDLGGKASTVAERIASKVNNGKEVTSKDIQRLMEANETVASDNAKTAMKTLQEAVTRKVTGYGEYGSKAFTEVMSTSDGQSVTDITLEFDTPYQAGLVNQNPDKLNLDTDLKVKAYRAGLLDYNAQHKIDKAHKPGVIYSEESSIVEWKNAPSDITQEEKNLAEALVKGLGTRMDFSSAEEAFNAFYDPDTGKTTFDAGFGISPALTKKLGSLDYLKKVEKLASERGHSFTFYLAHEIAIHRAMDLAPTEMRAFVNAMYTYKQSKTSGVNLAREAQETYFAHGVDLDTAGAFEEVVADSILELYDGDAKAFSDAIYSIVNGTDMNAKKGARTFLEWLSDTIERFKAWAKNLSGKAKTSAEKDISDMENLRNMFEQALAKSVDTVEQARKSGKAVSVAPKVTSENNIKNSIKELAFSTGIEATKDENGRVVFKIDGKQVTEVTPEHIRDNSGMGALIKVAIKSESNPDGTITKADAKKQYQMLADTMNMIINTQDPELVWAFMGAEMFSAVKSNSDGQYGTTIDFSTICRKTQDMIDAMSFAMMDLKRGLTKEEVTKLQAKVFKEKGNVPCPVCYVFSRWAGVGSLLDNMYNWQNKYENYTDAQIQDRIDELKNKLGKGKSKDLVKMLRDQDAEYDELSSKKEKLELDKKRLKSKKRQAVKENDARTLSEINNQIAEIDKQMPKIKNRINEIRSSVAPELSWLVNVRSSTEYANEGLITSDVLFNLNDAANFAKNYPLAWKYRSTRGAGMGKAILPYSDMRLGDLILGVDSNSANGNNLFADVDGEFNAEQREAIVKAIARTKAQNLIGGQRFQSTSDFRYDYALDYLMAFFEAQAIGSKIQTYTKIIEFADMIAAIGGDCNLSVMPKNKGYVTLPNGKHQLIFSSVTGINYEAAALSNRMHDNVQLILVGINDEHILAALEDSEETRGANIGFVIPYHTSGASINDFIRELVSNLGETFASDYYRDYEKVQGDKARKNATTEQKRRNDLRTKLLRGKETVLHDNGRKGSRNWEPSAEDLKFIRGESVDISNRSFEELRAIERKALRGDKAAIAEYESWTRGALWNLYEKLWSNTESENHGVRLNSGQAEKIMPHEYWNKNVGRDKAYINGFLFRSYCYNLGLTPRFNGITVKGETYGDFTDSKGYWKLLIDRPMYNNDGTYRDQQKVNVTKLQTEMLTPDYAKQNWGEYKVEEPSYERARRAADSFVEEAQKNTTTESGGKKYSAKYDYETLVAKPDMPLVTIDDTVQFDNTRAERRNVSRTGVENAVSVGMRNANGAAIVFVDDIGKDVVVSKRGIEHGFDRRFQVNGIVARRIGEILKNAIQINELTPKKQTASGSYVLLGAAKGKSGNLYIVEFVVNNFDNSVESVNVLHSVNTKKESAVLNAPALTENPLRITDSKISIAQILEIAIGNFPDVLPESVLRHYGFDARPDGEIGESALYSLKGAEETRTELRRIREEGVNAGKSASEIQQEVDEYVNDVRAENERASTRYSRDASDTRMYPERWTADRVGDKDKTPMSLSDIVAKIRHDFDLNITTGHIRGKGVRGQYNLRDKGIRTRVANNLPTIAHELGHALDDRYSITKDLAKELKDELSNGMDAGFRSQYKKSQWVSEGYAEFVRKFLQNRETTAIDYPEFTKHFLNSMSGKDAALIETLADEINAYYSLDADSATSAIKFREEGTTDFRTIGEKIKEKANVLYQEWVDSNRGIKKFDDATGTSTYKLASNAAYADAIAGQVIIGDLTDANGRYVAPGLKTALHGLNLKDKNEYRLFGEYLAVKHGPERLAEGQRIFADDRKNSSAFMERRQAELEEQFPHFAEISDRLYEFEREFLQTWGVRTGLVSADAAESWGERWKFYVPLNRAVSMDNRGMGAKRGFANQNSTIKKAHGSGLDIVHPVDNIINNIVKMVNAGVRNNVMRSITDAAQKFDANALFIEKIPTPMTRQGFDMSGVKDNLIELLEGSNLSKAGKKEAAQAVLSLDDILYQYGKGKAHGDVITVLKNGEQEFWKVNDAMLLSSITNMSQKSAEGILDAYAVVSRFMTSNITGNNIVWALFSNFPRDLQTFFVYSKNKNPIKALAAMGSAYANKVKGDNADPLYKEYLAMGGGQTSAYTADRDLAKRAREKLKGKDISANPIDWLSFMSNIIEAGPRFATYKLMRDAGLNSQEAFYEAMDITVNFRRGGRLARQTNKVVPFFNASVQGLDKFRRWITASDVHTSDRKKVVRGRMIAYLAVSAALGALTYGINNGDDEAEENYELLSNHTKNSFWCFPMGDGKYFAIPKPREIGVLSSFFETTMEYGIGDNDRAFDGFYDYVTNNALPSFAADVAQGDLYGVIGNLGIVGTGAYMMANRDFLGRPIVSASMQNLEPKDQYTDRTSKIAYWVGQAFDVSPTMVDYFFNSTLGGWHKAQKALFPVGGENVDFTLGVQNTYVKDNQYSNDLTNWLYDKAEQSKKASNSDPNNLAKAIEKSMDSKMASFYSNYNKLSKNLSETTSSRATRQTVLNMILEYQKASDNGYITKAQSIVYSICKKEGSTELLPSSVNTYVKDGDDKTRNLSAAQYVEYQLDYNRRYWDYVEDNITTSQSHAEKLAVLKAAKQTASDAAKDQVLSRIGAPKTNFSTKFNGVNYNDIVTFRAEVDLADDDSLKQDEVKDIILDMIRDGLDKEDAYTLFKSKYEKSDKNNPWRQYK